MACCLLRYKKNRCNKTKHCEMFPHLTSFLFWTYWFRPYLCRDWSRTGLRDQLVWPLLLLQNGHKQPELSLGWCPLNQEWSPMFARSSQPDCKLAGICSRHCFVFKLIIINIDIEINTGWNVLSVHHFKWKVPLKEWQCTSGRSLVCDSSFSQKNQSIENSKRLWRGLVDCAHHCFSTAC